MYLAEKLNDHFDKVQNLNEAKELYATTEAKMLGAQALTGMPHGTGVSDKAGALAAALADISAQIAILKNKVKETEPFVEAYVNSIDRPTLRLIFRYHYLYGLSWTEIADILGPGTSAESVRMRCDRYLKKKASPFATVL